MLLSCLLFGMCSFCYFCLVYHLVRVVFFILPCLSFGVGRFCYFCLVPCLLSVIFVSITAYLQLTINKVTKYNADR